MASRARAFAEASRDVRAGLTVDEALRDAEERHGFEATAQDRARLETLREAAAAAPQKAGVGGNPAHARETARDVEKKLEKWARMARAGVPLNGIETQMRIQGVKDAHAKAFARWYRDATENVEGHRALESLLNAKFILKLDTETQNGAEAKTLSEEDKDEDGTDHVADLDSMLLELGEPRLEHDDHSTLEKLQLEKGVDVRAKFQLARFVARIDPMAETQTLVGPKLVTPSLLRSLLLDPYCSQPEMESRDDLFVLRSLVGDLLPPQSETAGLALLKSAIDWLDKVDSHEGGSEAQAQAMASYFAGIDHPALAPVRCRGTTKIRYVGLLVTPDQDHTSTPVGEATFTVLVLNKHQADYHPQRLDGTGGAARVCPVITLRSVSRLRLLDPTFLVMLAKLHGQASKLNSTRVLYEVLLPFLADTRPLHLAAAASYSGEEVPFWVKAGRAHSSLVSVALLGLRLQLSAQNRVSCWKALKLELRCRVVEAALEASADTPLVSDWAEWAALRTQLARAALRSEEETKVSRRAKDLVTRLGERAEKARAAHRDASLTAAAAHVPFGLSSSTVARAADLISSAPVYRQTRAFANGNTVMQDGAMKNRTLSPETRLDKLGLVQDPTLPLVDRVAALHEVSQAYWYAQRRATVSTLVSEAVAGWLPIDPNAWMQCKAWAASARAQEETVSWLLELATWVVSSNTLCDGDRVVVVASLYAFANAVILAPKGASSLSQILSHEDVWPRARALHGADVNAVTACLDVSPWLLPVRKCVIRFLCKSPGAQQEELWDFSHFGTRRTRAEFVLQLATRLQETNDDGHSIDAPFAAQAFASAQGLFAAARDLALLFVWTLSPLPKTSSFLELPITCETTSVGCGEVVTHVYIGHEDIFHDHGVQRRRFRSNANALAFIPSAQALSASVDEDAIMRLNSVPTFGGFLSEEEAERLLSYLTAPFLRIPGLLAFFAMPGRAALLLNPDIRRLTCAALFEPLEVTLDDTELDVPWEELECPAEPERCRGPLRADSLLAQELEEEHTVVPGLLADVLEGLLVACRRVLPAPADLVNALSDIAMAGVVVEFLAKETSADRSRLGIVLREHCFSFLMKHGRQGACAAMYALQDAGAWDRSAEDVLRFALCSLHSGTHGREAALLRHLLASRPYVWADEIEMSATSLAALTTEILGAPRSFTGHDWTRCGASFCRGDVEVDLWAGDVCVHGAVPRGRLPGRLEQDAEAATIIAKYIRASSHSSDASSSDACVVLYEDDSTLCVEVQLLDGNKLVLSLDDAPPLDSRRVNKKRPQSQDCPALCELSSATVFTNENVATGSGDVEVLWKGQGSPSGSQVVHPGLVTKHGDVMTLYETLECGLVVPRDTSNWSACPFTRTQAGAPTTGCLTASLEVVDGHSLLYVPPWCMSVHLPGSLWTDRIFWLDEEQGLIWGHDGSDAGREDICVHVGSGAVQQGEWELVRDPPRELVASLGRLEDASHLLFWACSKGVVARIELVNRGLRFDLQEESGIFHLEGDASLFLDVRRDEEIAEESSAALCGLSRFVILTSRASEEVALVASVASARAFALARLDPARARLQPLSRHAALVVVVAKLAGRDYRGAVELVASTAADGPLTREEMAELNHLSKLAKVEDPDAVAARLWLLEATLLRSGNAVVFPKHVVLAHDVMRYLRTREHVDPKLRLSPHIARTVLRAAIKSGKQRISRWRQCATMQQQQQQQQRGEGGDASTDVDVQVMSVFLEYYDRGAATTVEMIPLQGGGGWHQLKEGAKRWAEETLDELANGGKSVVQQPSLREHLTLGPRLDWPEIHRVVSTALEIGWVDPCLVGFIKIVKGRGGNDVGDGVGLALVELLSARLYLHKQDVQGTSIFEWSSFQIMCLLTTGTHLRSLPSVPEGGNYVQQARYMRLLLQMLATNEIVDRWAVTRRFPLARLGEAIAHEALEVCEEGDVAFFGGIFDAKGEDSSMVGRMLLESTKAFNRLVDCRSPAHAQPNIAAEESALAMDASTFEELRGSRFADPFPGRERVIERIEADVRATRNHEFTQSEQFQARFKLASDHARVEKAIKWVDEDMAHIRNTIRELAREMETASANVFDEVEVAAQRRPMLEFWDLLRLAACSLQTPEVRSLPLAGAQALGRESCRLQLLGKVRDALIALRTCAPDRGNDANLAARRDRVLELLLTSWEHPGDPRWVIFEVSAGYTLRRSQVDTLESLDASAVGHSSCVQLKMGQGKSSTVLPLLSMALTSRVFLTIVAVPDALVDMSSQFLARALAPTFGKRVVHMHFSRYSLHGEKAALEASVLEERLLEARRARDVVLTTSGSLKALLLKLVELADTSTGQTPLEAAVSAVWQLLADAHLVLDECDVLLHPLRSELNFPIGPMQELAQASWRCGLARVLVGALQNAQREDSSALARAIKRGVDQGKLEATPHLVVVDPRFYEDEMTEPLAQSAAAWLCAELDGPDALLRPVQQDLKIRCSSNLDDDEHAGHHMLESETSSFWCSAEYPRVATVDLILPHKVHVGAIHVDFEEYSPFAMRSGLSMLPTKVRVLTSVDRGRSYHAQATSGTFVSKRLYLPKNAPEANRVRLELAGDARWFAIRQLKILQMPLANRQGGRWAPRLWRRCVKGSLPQDSPEALLGGAMADKSLSATQRSKAAVQAGIDPSAVFLVNLAATYIHVVLPHCLGKVNGVSHGLVQEAVAGGSATRRYMSVPFLGKGVPSPASEFAQPDVLIVLSLLAYQHSGLRRNDVSELVRLWQRDLFAQAGPLQERKAFLEYEAAIADPGPGMPPNSLPAVLPLHLAQASSRSESQDDAAGNNSNGLDSDENAIWQRLRFSPVAVRTFLERVAFPAALKHRARKLVAGGEEMVMSVGRTHGFSGTPSSAMPSEMGECQWEEGTEGRFWATLTNRECVEVSAPLELGWTVDALLHQVAQDTSLCALIDTGALIVGLSNREVAWTLLEHGLDDLKGCVYLDAQDRQRVLLRSDQPHGGHFFRDVPLAEAALSPDQRFTFYDHVHTTGMDIAQPVLGRAAMTIGKDMTFRDYCQGAWRMRRLGMGQCLHILVPRVVMELLSSELSRSFCEKVPIECQLACWLQLRGLNDLANQENTLREAQVRTLWRRAALAALRQGHKRAIAVRAFTSAVSFDLTSQLSIPTLKREADACSALLETRAKRAEVQKALRRFGQSAPSRFGGVLRRVMNAEQQQEQERERERQVEVSGDVNRHQGRAWAGQANLAVPWNAGLLMDPEGLSSRGFWQAGDIAKLGECATHLVFSRNHSAPNPEVTARLRNVETGVIMGNWLIVLSLAEANSLRWALAPVPILFVESAVTVGQRGKTLAVSKDSEAVLLARFIGAAHEFDDHQVKLLGRALHYLTLAEVRELYVTAKRHRRGLMTDEHEALLTRIAK